MTERYIGFTIDEYKNFTGEIKITKPTKIKGGYPDRIVISETLINKAVKFLKETHKTKEFFSVSGILICRKCVEKNPVFEDILEMTIEELAETNNAYIPDVTAYFEKVPQVIFQCSECKISWSNQ